MSITIIHTRAEGTLVEGTGKGDGTDAALSRRKGGLGFKWSGMLGCWYLPRSRDHRADTYTINQLAQRLRDMGFEVTVTIDEEQRRTFAEAEADREEKAEARAERFADYAGNAASRSASLSDSAHRMGDAIPFGQPILVGHHSEGRDRRYRERMDNKMRKSFAESDRASHWAGREQAAASYKAFRNDPPRTLRRIDKLEAQLRRVEKWQAGKSAGGDTVNIENPDVVAELAREHQELTEEIAHWKDVIKKAEAEGFKVWSKADFAKGDFVRCRGRWYEVMRVNAKSVSVPHVFTGQRLVTAADMERNLTTTLPYDEVTGRRSAEELAQILADPAQ
jgi:transcription elongation GreA/GreB family factor